MPSESEPRHAANAGLLVQGAIVVGVGVYTMFVLFYWLFTS